MCILTTGVIAIDFQSLHFACVSTNSLHVIMHVIFSLLWLILILKKLENLAGNFVKLSCEIVEIVSCLLVESISASVCVYVHDTRTLAY